VGQTYEDKGKILYSILLPQSSLRDGGNHVVLYKLGGPAGAAAGGGQHPTLTQLWSSSDQ
jgi:hypothetical protein